MATKTKRELFRPVTYRPTLEEIAEKTAVFRERKLKQMREMTKDDICNVEPVSAGEVYDALHMVPDDDSRWAIVDGKEVL